MNMKKLLATILAISISAFALTASADVYVKGYTKKRRIIEVRQIRPKATTIAQRAITILIQGKRVKIILKSRIKKAQLLGLF